MPNPIDLDVTTLGPCTRLSPLALLPLPGVAAAYVSDEARVALEIEGMAGAPPPPARGFEKAGPRERIFFDPERTRAAIVTSGGLCPGINNVIRSIILELHHKYGLRDVLGFRYGYEGLDPASGLEPIPLGPEQVRTIHTLGGSVLGVSRGKHDVGAMVDTLLRHEIGLLFAVGGDGTLRGAHALHEEIARRGRKIAVVGVPKTIDNDIAFVDKTFGFDTAVELATLAIRSAHTEAVGARNGIGIVKLMGRDAGFIAAAATLASHDVNYCLVPEVPFDLGGPHGLFASLGRRLRERSHALVVVAEGCGASLPATHAERDSSGHVRYASPEADIGPHLRDAITAHFRSAGPPVTVKYIDPSYMIRSVPANASDSILCDALARNAVHAGMAGKTDIVVGRWHRVFTHVPLALATGAHKRIDPGGPLWFAVTETTGQPPLVAV
jgi:6-phosphofructokinase 1